MKKMKKISVCYSTVNNMGDELNKDVIEKCFHVKVIRKSSIVAKLSGIGSGLSAFCYNNDKNKNRLKRISGKIFSKSYVWGTGFISYDDGMIPFFKKNMQFCSVRGRLTKNKVENLIGKKLEIPLGDGGILSSYLLDEKIEKKYDLGIIPHFREKEEHIFFQLNNKFKNSIIIDVQDEPINVIRKIAKCKVILSSSLHGLIIADSLRIPNKHIVVTNKLLGDGFKFDDYYSAYNLNHDYIDLNKEELENIDKVVEEYKITDKMVEKMKIDLLRAFPYKNKEN